MRLYVNLEPEEWDVVHSILCEALETEDLATGLEKISTYAVKFMTYTNTISIDLRKKECGIEVINYILEKVKDIKENEAINSFITGIYDDIKAILNKYNYIEVHITLDPIPTDIDSEYPD